MLLVEGQSKIKCCAFASITLYPQLSFVPLDNLTGNEEAYTQRRISFFFSDLIEALENLLLLLFGNPSAIILNAYYDIVEVF